MILYEIGSPNYPILNRFWRDRSPFSVIIGPLGSGKTYTAAQRLMRQMMEQEPNQHGVRPTRWITIRNTYRDLISTSIKDFSAIFGSIERVTVGGQGPPSWHGHWSLSDGTVVDAEVEFIALEREDDVRRLRGVQATGIWLNECRELERAAVSMADLRHGRYPSMADGGVRCTWHGMIGDTNAFDTEHWLYAQMRSPPQGWTFHVQPGGVLRRHDAWVPNPDAENVHNLPADYYARGVLGKKEDWIRCNLANEFVFSIDGKAVHPEFFETLHVSRERIAPQEGLPLILGCDFGRTPAMTISQRLHSGAWNVLEELWIDDASAATFGPVVAQHLRAKYPAWDQRRHAPVTWPIIGWGDPAGTAQGQATEDTPLQMLRASGVPCEAAPTNDPLLRRAALTGPLTRSIGGRPGILVDPGCVRLIKGLAGGFHYRRIKVSDAERYTEAPDKNEYSHICEALEYSLLGEGEGMTTLHTLPADRVSMEDWPEYAEM